MKRNIRIGQYVVPLWLIGVLLTSGIISGVVGYHIWQTITMDLEVEEPLEIMSYPDELNLFPGETKEFNITITNEASVNYTVILDFSLDNETYQNNYVTFSDETYTIVSGQHNITAWLKVQSYAPPINVSLTIDLRRIADWWNDSWKHRIRVNITENSGYSLRDFPVEVTFEHNGNVQPDGDDIRVIADGVELPYATLDLNNTHAKLIFEIDVTASDTKTVYIYYDNPTATPPNYPNVPLIISEGTTGYAIIDNSVYIGWDYTSWGWSNDVVLWNDFRIDFNGNNDHTDDNDLIRDYGSRQGGIGRHRANIQAIGLGEYRGYVQTPVYVDINFADAMLRVYRNHPWVETTQADFLFMFSTSYTHANYRSGTEQNIVDGDGTNRPELWNVLYLSKENPGWIAFRDDSSGDVFASTGLRIGSDYAYHQAAKEASDWDRVIDYSNRTRYDPLEPYDQTSECKIYWYADNTNGYLQTEITATILNNPPSVVVVLP